MQKVLRYPSVGQSMKPIWVIGSTLAFIATLLSVNGCSILSSGTWEDDPGNWGRAFRATQPDHVVVLHSRYWRSPHWTLEFEYFFEIESNDTLREQLLTQNNLTQLDSKDAETAIKDFFGEVPIWFLPKAIDKYEVWVYEDQTDSHFRVFIDKETGTLFLTDYLV